MAVLATDAVERAAGSILGIGINAIPRGAKRGSLYKRGDRMSNMQK